MDGQWSFSRTAGELLDSESAITPRALARAKTPPTLIDVRPAEEYARGHVEGALSLPWPSLLTRISEIVPAAGSPFVVYCGRGDRAAEAARALRAAGYVDVRYLAGGVQRWLESGGVLEVPARAPRAVARRPSNGSAGAQA